MNIPFYENTDSTHCLQAVLRMILKHHWPEKDYSWGKLEEITAKVEGLWTWPTAMMLWLHNKGFEVLNVETFDYTKLAEKGGSYLVELFGEEVAQEQIAHSDMEQEIKYAKQIAKVGLCESRIPQIPELKKRLDEGYVLICNVNSRALNQKEGFVGHFVLLTSYNDTQFFMHDPGPPGIKDRKVIFAEFEKAWAYPNKNAQNYIAIKPSS